MTTQSQEFTILQGPKAVEYAMMAAGITLYQGQPHDTTQPLTLIEADDLADETPNQVWCYGD